MSDVKDEASGFGDFLGGRGGHSFRFENEGHFPLGPAAELGTVGAAGARGISFWRGRLFRGRGALCPQESCENILRSHTMPVPGRVSITCSDPQRGR